MYKAWVEIFLFLGWDKFAEDNTKGNQFKIILYLSLSKKDRA